MKTNFIATEIFFLLFVVCAFSSCDNATPCDCWKNSYWSKHKDECDKAAWKMGLENWNRKINECKDYSLKEDKINGYIKLDKVVVESSDGLDHYWQEVYVKE